MSKLKSDLLELLAEETLKQKSPSDNQTDFENALIIFHQAMMDQIWIKSNMANKGLLEIGDIVDSYAHDFRKLILKYTKIDTHNLFNP